MNVLDRVCAVLLDSITLAKATFWLAPPVPLFIDMVSPLDSSPEPAVNTIDPALADVGVPIRAGVTLLQVYSYTPPAEFVIDTVPITTSFHTPPSCISTCCPLAISPEALPISTK